jgi:hypothetical protein
MVPIQVPKKQIGLANSYVTTSRNSRGRSVSHFRLSNMNHDDYMALKRGKLTIIRGMESMITEVGSGVYTYMVMLSNAGRDQEAGFFGDIRERVFSIRSKIAEDTTQEGLDQLSNEMMGIYRDLNTAYIYLPAHKPEEACILQSVSNTACGLVYNIKHFKDRA